MRFNKLVFPGLGMMVAVIVLGVSLWKYSEERAYADVVSENLQDIMRLNVGEGNSEYVRSDVDLVLPGDIDYYPRVVVERLKWWTSRGDNKVSLAMNFSSERFAMARELVQMGDSVAAMKTANKGVHYLTEAARMLRSEDADGIERSEYWAHLLEEAITGEETLVYLKNNIHELVAPAIDEMRNRVIEIVLEAEEVL